MNSSKCCRVRNWLLLVRSRPFRHDFWKFHEVLSVQILREIFQFIFGGLETTQRDNDGRQDPKDITFHRTNKFASNLVDIYHPEMRLDIAVGILSHTLPMAGSSLLHVDRRKRERSLMHQSDRAAPLHNVKPESRNVRTDVLEKSKPRNATRSASARASRKDAKECNPRSSNPDVGIFSCGTDNHCIKDDESTLGGFCVAYMEARTEAAMHRSLQDGGLCDDIYLNCDCQDFANGVGTYVCTSSECVDDADTICGTKKNVVVVNDDGSYRTSTCFVDTDGSPIESYCYTTLYDGFTKSGCELEYNGVMCSSCTHVICADEFGGEDGLEFDCSNASADVSAKGTTCDGGDWRDFFLNPGAMTMPVATESTPAPGEPTISPGVPEPTTNVPETQASGTMVSESMQPSVVNSIKVSPEPTAEPTSDASILITRAPNALSALITLAFLAGTAVA